MRKKVGFGERRVYHAADIVAAAKRDMAVKRLDRDVFGNIVSVDLFELAQSERAPTDEHFGGHRFGFAVHFARNGRVRFEMLLRIRSLSESVRFEFHKLVGLR